MGSYLVKEMFGPTVQGEGSHAGKSCVFLRFAACNLACSWCDTDFSKEGAVKLSADEIVANLKKLDSGNSKMVVVTGGEPAMQWDQEIATQLKDAGFVVHMESNGTRELKAPVDWLTISPKPQFHGKSDRLVGLSPNECKVVVDGSVSAETLSQYEKRYQECEAWFVQPCDFAEYHESLAKTLALVQAKPNWRLSIQMHKVIGVE